MPIDKALLKRIKDNDVNLINLDLSDRKLNDEDIKQLVKVLTSNSKITFLNFRCNQIRQMGAKYLSEFLAENNTIVDLNLGENPIGDKGMEYLCEVLKKNTTLKYLKLASKALSAKDFRGIELEKGFGKVGAKHLREALKINTTLTYLDIKGNEINPAGAKALSEALKINNTLEILDLSGNNIRNDGAKDLTEALLINRTLLYLNLSSNFITSLGVKHLCSVIIENDILMDLDLSGNQIISGTNRDEKGGIEYLKEALQKNKTLGTLIAHAKYDCPAENLVEIFESDNEKIKDNDSFSQSDKEFEEDLGYSSDENTAKQERKRESEAQGESTNNTPVKKRKSETKEDEQASSQDNDPNNGKSESFSDWKVSTKDIDYDNIFFETVNPTKPTREVEKSKFLFFKKPSKNLPLLNDEEKIAIGKWGEKVVYRTLKAHYKRKYKVTDEQKPASDSDRLRFCETKLGFAIVGYTESGSWLDLEVIWHNKERESGKHVDFEIIKNKITRYVEVKTTRSNEANILNISSYQWDLMWQHRKNYRLFRVYGAGTTEAKIEKINDPFQAIIDGDLTPEAAQFRL